MAPASWVLGAAISALSLSDRTAAADAAPDFSGRLLPPPPQRHPSQQTFVDHGTVNCASHVFTPLIGLYSRAHSAGARGQGLFEVRTEFDRSQRTNDAADSGARSAVTAA